MKAICQQASKLQTVIDMHVLKHPTVSLNHIFQLFDTLIKPILTYGCAVWGTGNYTDIETYHNKFLKRTLRVKSSTNTCLLYMEIPTLCFHQYVYCEVLVKNIEDL